MQEDLLSRGIGGGAVSVQSYTYYEAHVLQILSVMFFSLSIIAAILTLYGFYIMRRSFRHDLVMILITSGMFKASWCWIYGIVILNRGNIDISSAFCQVSGFFLALGTEASDLAVLMIAIHNTLYILNPPTSLGEGGLYPYRRTVFAIWGAGPILLASLAFTNPSYAYSPGAISCYLPDRPFWYRLALAWIPRYIIFVAILIMDTSIYFYVRYKFGNFSDTIRKSRETAPKLSKQQPRNPRETDNILLKASRRCSVPPTPPLAYNELLPETRHTSWDTMTDATERPSNIRRTTTLQKLANHPFPNHSQQMAPIAPLTSSEPEIHSGDLPAAATQSLTSTAPPLNTITWRSFVSRVRSHESTRYSLRSFLMQSRQTSTPNTLPTPPPSIELVRTEGCSTVKLPVLEARAKTRQQLRFLFVYPLTYLCVWIVPFAGHVVQYDDKYVLNPPYVLNAVVVVILGSQCFLDCLLFSWREKPWRHMLQNRKTWAQLWADIKVWKMRETNLKSPKRGPGKSRAAMSADARIAYRRRDIEMSEATLSSANRVKRVERSWWDEEEEYESMDPLNEFSASRLVMRGALENTGVSNSEERRTILGAAKDVE